MVEGFLAAHALFGVRPDPGQYAVQIDPQILRRNPQYGYSLCRQPHRSTSVMLRPLCIAVLLPIDLDRQPRLGAVEVEHKDTDRMLPSEFQASQLTTAQTDPQPRFRRRQAAPQHPRPADGSLRRQEPLRLSAALRATSPCYARGGDRCRDITLCYSPPSPSHAQHVTHDECERGQPADARATSGDYV